MKTTLRVLGLLLLSFKVLGQAPQKMSYQSVIRNSSNALVISTPIGIKVSILQGNASGVTVYSETHNTSTNANGLVSIEVGGGTVVSGSFNSINWGAGPHFVKTEIDISGGTNYTITGISQLLSVPYSLFSNCVPVSVTPTGDTVNVGCSKIIIPGVSAANTKPAMAVMYIKGADSILIDTTKWHYVALTKNNLSGSLYLDGKLILNSTFDNVPYIWNSLLLGATQGCVSCSPVPNFTGVIDDVRISNIARSTSEITTYYNSDSSLKTDANTIALFKFESPSGNVLINSASSTNGIIYGSPQYINGRFGKGLKLSEANGDYGRFSGSIPVNNMTLEFWYYSNDTSGVIAMLEYAFNTGIYLKPIIKIN